MGITGDLGCKSLLNGDDVLLRHLVVDLGHEPSFVMVLSSDLPEHVQVRWQFRLVLLVGRLHAQDRDVIRIKVLEGLDDEVLAIEREALTDFEDLVLFRVTHLAEFDVLTCCYLPLLDHFFTVDVVAHFMAVGIAVILAQLAKNIALYLHCFDERFFQREDFQLVVRWHSNLEVPVVRNQ